MLVRIIVGLLIGGGLLAVALLGPTWSHYTLLIILSAMAGWECFSMLDKARLPNFRIFGTIAGIGYLIAQMYGLGGDSLLLFLVGFLIFIFLCQMVEGANDSAIAQVAGTLFGFFYVFGLMSCCIKIIKGGTLEGGAGFLGNALQAVSGADLGNTRLLLFVIVVTKCSDIGAYFTGSAIGRTKVAPRLSPGKTWEGCIGGVLFSIAIAYLFAWLSSRELYAEQGIFKIANFTFTTLQVGVTGAVLAVSGIFGDLAESLIKRSARTKDSSTWLPGMGGILDMLDSILFAAPAFYFIMIFWLN